jgi:DNA-binding transcriptional LysR family regulator
MRYRHVDLNLLLVFHELIQSGSVLRASRALGVTQGAVSQALAKLRKHYGDELFIKTNTGVSPTALALALAEDVRQTVVSAEAALVGRAQFDPLKSTRDIKICMPDMGEIRMLPKMLSVFQELAPQCRVIILDLWGEELKVGFERGEVDLAINARESPMGDMLQQRLFDDSFVLLTGKNNRLNHPVSMEDVCAARHIGVSPGRLDPLHIVDPLAAAGVRRNIVAWVSNWVTLPHLLQAQHDLVAIVPGYLATAYQKFDLKTLKLKFELPRIAVFQFWHRRSTSDPYNMWLRAQVRSIFGSPATQGQGAEAVIKSVARSSPAP